MKFHPGDIVIDREDLRLRTRGKVMIVIESYRARKDQGTYYRVLSSEGLEFRHESQIRAVKD